ncbi:transmembrane signal peptide protein [Phyllobacterium sp. SYP-B3895]|uniref:RcnB family protein n=1 Tax=Phyllobacterium sp. SYP-B3895 TaxID=2663240 RepID=UPI000DDC9989|nr:RcnB family protein [Phyllobacterium sp. SYP-B3895]MRG56209.1 transmembrane signal peptide protein [Phyllobacterium sp. SYP-B3895]
MKKIALATLALSLLASPAAFAQQQHSHQGYRYGHPKNEVVVKKTVTVKRNHWSRGKQLPPSYRRHVVRDYHRYHLRTPPRGYQWVKADNDYVMVSIATGIISALVQAR